MTFSNHDNIQFDRSRVFLLRLLAVWFLNVNRWKQIGLHWVSSVRQKPNKQQVEVFRSANISSLGGRGAPEAEINCSGEETLR